LNQSKPSLAHLHTRCHTGGNLLEQISADKNHNDRNAARKKTDEEKRAKKLERIGERERQHDSYLSIETDHRGNRPPTFSIFGDFAAEAESCFSLFIF